MCDDPIESTTVYESSTLYEMDFTTVAVKELNMNVTKETSRPISATNVSTEAKEEEEDEDETILFELGR